MGRQSRAFGFLAHRALQEAAIRLADADQEKADDRRRDQLTAFEVFCQQQRTRVSATLKQQTDRINRARYGDCEGDHTVFVVSRKGTTESSRPVKRQYQEQ